VIVIVSDRVPLIVHIIHHLGIGGLENGLVNLINTIPADRYRHAVVCLTDYDEFAERITRKDVGLFSLGKRPGKDFGCYYRLFKLLRRLRPDIVHTRNIGTLDCQFIAAAAGARYRIHGEHGWEVGDLHGIRRSHVQLRRLSRAVVHQYVAVSRHMATWLENVIRVPTAKTSQIYNGIDSGKFKAACGVESNRQHSKAGRPDEFVVGTVGRLDPIKDHLTLLRAFDVLVRRLRGKPELQLVIVGSGEMRQELEQLVRDWKIEPRVSFTGSTDDVATLLRSFDLFVLPSMNEGISNTILEAMATGLPVVASAVGGNAELVVDGVSGSLFQCGNSEELADRIQEYIEDRSLRCAQGKAGRARAVDDFGLETMTDRYVALYDQHKSPEADFRRSAG